MPIINQHILFALFGVFTVNVLIIEPVIIFIETMYKKMVLYGSIIIDVIKEGVLTEVGSIGTLTVLSLIFLGSCIYRTGRKFRGVFNFTFFVGGYRTQKLKPVEGFVYACEIVPHPNSLLPSKFSKY